MWCSTSFANNKMKFIMRGSHHLWYLEPLCRRNLFASSFSIYLMLAILLTSNNSFDLNWLSFFNHQQPVSSSNAVGNMVMARQECGPLRNLIATRFNRSPMRVLRDDVDFNDMQKLIRIHHNCLIKADRIRFKKSSSSPNLQQNQSIDENPASGGAAVFSSNQEKRLLELLQYLANTHRDHEKMMDNNPNKWNQIPLKDNWKVVLGYQNEYNYKNPLQQGVNNEYIITE